MQDKQDHLTFGWSFGPKLVFDVSTEIRFILTAFHLPLDLWYSRASAYLIDIAIQLVRGQPISIPPSTKRIETRLCNM
jgi:hypothetical protein